MPRAYEQIEGWFDFADIYDQAVAEAPQGDRDPCESRFVEVGVWKGRSLCYLAEKVRESGKRIILYGVDPFQFFPNQQQICEEQLQRAGTRDLVTLFVMPSVNAAALLGDELDFVFIDGDHSDEAVTADIAAWWPKVRRGGVLAGHDFNHPEFPGVTDAVERWARENHLAITLRGTSWWIRKP